MKLEQSVLSYTHTHTHAHTQTKNKKKQNKQTNKTPQSGLNV